MKAGGYRFSRQGFPGAVVGRGWAETPGYRIPVGGGVLGCGRRRGGGFPASRSVRRRSAWPVGPAGFSKVRAGSWVGGCGLAGFWRGCGWAWLAVGFGVWGRSGWVPGCPNSGRWGAMGVFGFPVWVRRGGWRGRLARRGFPKCGPGLGSAVAMGDVVGRGGAVRGCEGWWGRKRAFAGFPKRFL